EAIGEVLISNLEQNRNVFLVRKGRGLKIVSGHEGLDMARDRIELPTRGFSVLLPRLCVPIGHYWYLFKRLTAVSGGRFSRFEHIVAYSSFKAHSKQRAISGQLAFSSTMEGVCSALVQAQKARWIQGLMDRPSLAR